MQFTEKFTGKADIYSKYRPNYPEEFLDYLISENNLNNQSIISDIGAGTGKLSKQLLDKGLKLICIEPNDDMRITAINNLNGYSNVTFINATAENTGLPDKSVDLITVAQAFHWFNHEKFKIECKRILIPNSKVSLVWNSRDPDNAFIKENHNLNKRNCPDFIGFSGGTQDDKSVLKDFYKNGEYELKTFINERIMTLDAYIGGSLSSSYAPKENDQNYNRYIFELTELYNKYSNNDTLLFPIITHSYLGYV